MFDIFEWFISTVQRIDGTVQFRASYGTLHSTVKRHLCFRALKGTVYSTVQRLGFIQSSSTVHSSETVGFMIHRAQFYSPVRDSLVYSTAQRNVSRWVIRYISQNSSETQYGYVACLNYWGEHLNNGETSNGPCATVNSRRNHLQQILVAFVLLHNGYCHLVIPMLP